MTDSDVTSGPTQRPGLPFKILGPLGLRLTNASQAASGIRTASPGPIIRVTPLIRTVRQALGHGSKNLSKMEESKVSEKPTIRAPLKFLGRDEWLSLIPLQASDDFIIYFSLTENTISGCSL